MSGQPFKLGVVLEIQKILGLKPDLMKKMMTDTGVGGMASGYAQGSKVSKAIETALVERRRAIKKTLGETQRDLDKVIAYFDKIGNTAGADKLRKQLDGVRRQLKELQNVRINVSTKTDPAEIAKVRKQYETLARSAGAHRMNAGKMVAKVGESKEGAKELDKYNKSQDKQLKKEQGRTLGRMMAEQEKLISDRRQQSAKSRQADGLAMIGGIEARAAAETEAQKKRATLYKQDQGLLREQVREEERLDKLRKKISSRHRKDVIADSKKNDKVSKSLASAKEGAAEAMGRYAAAAGGAPPPKPPVFGNLLRNPGDKRPFITRNGPRDRFPDQSDPRKWNLPYGWEFGGSNGPNRRNGGGGGGGGNNNNNDPPRNPRGGGGSRGGFGGGGGGGPPPPPPPDDDDPRSWRRYTREINAATRAARAHRASMEQLRLSSDSYAKSAALAFKRFTAFLGPSTVLFSTIFAFKSAISDAIAFEKVLTKIQQSLETNNTVAASVGGGLRNIATSRGLRATDIGAGALTFAQAGYGRDNPLQLIEAMDAVAKTQLAPTFGDIGEVTDGLLAIFGQFNKKISETAPILDLVNQYANDFAVESRDIFEGAKRGGAAFAAAGGQLEDFIRLFSVLRETTRESPESLGVFFKTGIAKLLTLRGQATLSGLGVGSGSITQQLTGLSKVFQGNKFSGIEKINLAEDLVGERQYTRLLNLLKALQDPTMLEKLDQAASKSVGSLDRSISVRADDIAVSMAKIREEFNKFISDIILNEDIKKFVSTISSLTASLLKLGGAISSIGPELLLLGGSLVAGPLLRTGGKTVGNMVGVGAGGDSLRGIRRGFKQGGLSGGLGMMGRGLRPALNRSPGLVGLGVTAAGMAMGGATNNDPISSAVVALGVSFSVLGGTLGPVVGGLASLGIAVGTLIYSFRQAQKDLEQRKLGQILAGINPQSQLTKEERSAVNAMLDEENLSKVKRRTTLSSKDGNGKENPPGFGSHLTTYDIAFDRNEIAVEAKKYIRSIISNPQLKEITKNDKDLNSTLRDYAKDKLGFDERESRLFAKDVKRGVSPDVTIWEALEKILPKTVRAFIDLTKSVGVTAAAIKTMANLAGAIAKAAAQITFGPTKPKLAQQIADSNGRISYARQMFDNIPTSLGDVKVGVSRTGYNDAYIVRKNIGSLKELGVNPDLTKQVLDRVSRTDAAGRELNNDPYKVAALRRFAKEYKPLSKDTADRIGINLNDLKKRIGPDMAQLLQSIADVLNINVSDVINQLASNTDKSFVEAFDSLTGDKDQLKEIRQLLDANDELIKQRISVENSLQDTLRSSIREVYDLTSSLDNLQNRLSDTDFEATSIISGKSPDRMRDLQLQTLRQRALTGATSGISSVGPLRNSILSLQQEQRVLQSTASDPMRLADVTRRLADAQQELAIKSEKLQARFDLLSDIASKSRDRFLSLKEGVQGVGSSLFGTSQRGFAEGNQAFQKFIKAAGGFNILAGNPLSQDNRKNFTSAVNSLNQNESLALSDLLNKFSSINLGRGVTGSDILGNINTAIGAQAISTVTGRSPDDIIDEIKQAQKIAEADQANVRKAGESQIALLGVQTQMAKDNAYFYQTGLQDILNSALEEIADVMRGGGTTDIAATVKANEAVTVATTANTSAVNLMTASLDRTNEIFGKGLTVVNQLEVQPLQVNVALSVPDILAAAGPMLATSIIDKIKPALLEVFKGDGRSTAIIQGMGKT